ncbi:MAG: sugar ABC transporter substrate-binding protein [Burkholderiales bacterium]|jgi:multiple sugar transport system substrate-binding protein|nr:sugar ABC transporter substrate-binding protein [Burkholderiales bacterium]
MVPARANDNRFRAMRRSAARFVAATAGMFLVGMASAAAPAAKDSPASTTRTITAWSPASPNSTESHVIKAAAQAFNLKQRDFRVDIQFSDVWRYDELVRNAAIGGGLPCLIETDGPLQPGYIWSGFLLALDTFVPKPLLNDLLPSIITQGTYNGRLYSLGQFDSGLGLWGNRRYLRAAGVRVATLEAPWSLAEFEQALQKLTALDGVEYAINFSVYYALSEFSAYALSPIVQGFGGDLIDRTHYQSAKGVLDGPQAVEAMKRFQQWFRNGWSKPIVDRSDDFEQGRTALSWTGNWMYQGYRKALGDDLVLMPLPDLGHGIKTGMGSWGWNITSTCQDPAAAWAFIAHLMSSEEILRITNSNGAVPARRSVLARSPLYGPRGPLRMFALQLAAGLGVPRPKTPAYITIRTAYANAVSAIVAGGDVQAELSKAARIIDADIARNRGYRP